jgi:hypothetical protein
MKRELVPEALVPRFSSRTVVEALSVVVAFEKTATVLVLAVIKAMPFCVVVPTEKDPLTDWLVPDAFAKIICPAAGAVEVLSESPPPPTNSLPWMFREPLKVEELIAICPFWLTRKMGEDVATVNRLDGEEVPTPTLPAVTMRSGELVAMVRRAFAGVVVAITRPLSIVVVPFTSSVLVGVEKLLPMPTFPL